MISCDFVGNLASNRGTAVYDFSNNGSTITNCIIWNNRSLAEPGTHLKAFFNTTVTYNCIEGGHLGLGNIDADPQFVNDGEWNENGTPEDTGDDFWVDGDYHLHSSSPCINAARNGALPTGLTVDLDGDDRVQQCRVDMGVDETPYFRDCNANGTGDACDIALVTSGDCNDNDIPDDCESMVDCNGNGVQDLCDLASGTSVDCNTNELPDDCEPGGQADCDGDGQSDLCEIHLGNSPDCNANALADACDGPVIYVDDDATEGARDGSSWTDAYTDLQDALAEAITCGIVFRQIHIAQGTYHPGEARTDYFRLINHVTVSGGYRGIDPNTPGDPEDRDVALYVTFLSGDLEGDDFADPTGIQDCFRGDGVQYVAGYEVFDEDGDGDIDAIDAHIDDNSYHVFLHLSELDLNAKAVLDGVTVAGGNGDSLSGGGMANYRASPTVTNCTFDGNWGDWGGGMYNSSGGMSTFPTVTGCTFRRNWAERGGGMFNRESSPWLTDCVFTENRALTLGGAINNSIRSSPRLTNCLVNRNYAKWHGGGMYNFYSSSPVVSRCTFSENDSRLSGGAMYNSNSHAHIDLCTFSRNIAGAPGGGIYNTSSKIQVSNTTFDGNSGNLGGGMYNQFNDPILFNCIFSGNVARTLGGGMYNRESRPRVVNCAFTGNTAVNNGGAIYNMESEPTVTNCILWGNVPSEIYNVNSTPAITYSDVEGEYEGEGNIDADPRFVDNGHWDNGGTPNPNDDVWTSGDYHLQTDSPCINTGDNENVILPAGFDFERDKRIQHCRVDMGPDETPNYRDCNANDNPDACDIADGASIDCNRNVTPDECDPVRDCNANGVQDICDVAAGTHADCNGNEIPDECEGPIVYLDDDATGGENSGTSWTDAFTNLQAAVADVLVCGPLFTEIHVAQGTYRPGSTRDSSFRLVNGVTFAGGFRGIDPAHPGDPDDRDIRSFETVLSGDLASDDGPDTSTRSDNSYHVFYHPFGLALDETAVLDGVTITGGYASSLNVVSGRGGGMYNHTSSPTVINTTLVRNTGLWGGGMYNQDSLPSLTNCLLIGNKGSPYGGGMYNFSSDPTLTNCTINGNSADIGGGIYNTGSSPALTNCTINGNSADIAGGISNTGGSPAFTNCTIVGNSADIAGGMLNSNSDPTLTNCTFAVNSAESGNGGGLYNFRSDSTLTNCVLWGNVPSELYNYSSTPTVTYCNIENGFPGEANLNSDPMFTRIPDPGLDGAWGTDDDDYGDLRPRPGSPCIDAGDPEFVPAQGERDLQGFARVHCDRVDIGAFEFAGDFDCNRTLDLRDVAGLQNCFTGEDLGPYDSGCEAFDFDGDLDLDIHDFAEFEQLFSH